MEIDKKLLKEAMGEVLDETMKPLYVEREQHNRDHLKIQSIEYKDIAFLKEWREWCTEIKSTTIKTIVKVVVGAVIVLILLGIGVWVRAKYLLH